MINFIKNLLKRDNLITLFYVLSIPSFLTGVALLSYFFYILHSYFIYDPITKGHLMAQTAQSVDFMGVTYGCIWIFIAFLLFALAQRMKLISLRYRIKSTTTEETFLYAEKFETDFLNNMKKHLEIVHEINLLSEDWFTENCLILRKKEKEAIDFFEYTYSILAKVSAAFQSGHYPNEENSDLHNCLQLLDISPDKFTKIQRSTTGNKKHQIIELYKILYKRFFFYNHRYFENIELLLCHIDTYHRAVGAEDGTNLDIEEIERFTKLLSSHFSMTEANLLFYHSISFPEFRSAAMEKYIFDALKPEKLLDIEHIQWLQHKTG